MEATTLDTRATAELAIAGDKRAFAELVAAYDRDLTRVCVVITGDAWRAREAVQDAWQLAWSRRTQLRHADRFFPWILAIACNNARLETRRASKRAERESATAQVVGSQRTDDVPDPDLSLALRRLGPNERQVIALKYVLGFTSAEIGMILGLSAPGVRVRLTRAIARLRKELS